MLIKYDFSGDKYECQTKDKNPQILLANKIGGFFLWQENPDSRYRGFFLKKGKNVFKSIEKINLHKKSKIKSIENNFIDFSIKREDGTEENFFMPYGFDALIYSTNRQVCFDLELDMRKIFDNDDFERIYSFEEREGKLILEYKKQKEGEKEYELFVVIFSDDFEYKIKKDWVLKDYNYDLLRKDPPFGRYVFSAVSLCGSDFVFVVSDDKKKAQEEADYLFKNREKIKKDHKLALEKFKEQNKLPKKDKSQEFAFLSAKFHLFNMLVYKSDAKLEGIYAGLPWFCQFWPRDSLFCLNALPKKEKKELFLLFLEEFSNNKKIEFFGQKNADAEGIFFKRAEDLMSEGVLNDDQIHSVKNLLEEHIKNELAFNTKDSFAINGPKQTWMDTDFDGDARDGARIEMQALRLKMYNLAGKLTGSRKYFELEAELAKKVREKFFDGEFLKDGISDKRVRPNIFLAHYFYPELLRSYEWSLVFENALYELWLEWGGVSTISKKDKMFCKKYRDCQDPNQSYHHGDSWYFLNNICAISLSKVNYIKFKDKIEKILQASKKDILESGVLGSSSELSSAQEQTSFGCQSQSWSLAMYIEAIDKIED